jgi:hypothetical protein
MNKEIISEYFLERYVLGELPEEVAGEIRRMASKDPDLQAVLNEIEASNRDILSLYPPHSVKETLLKKLNESPDRFSGEARPDKFFSRRRIFYLSSAFAAALLLLVIFVPRLFKEAAISQKIFERDESLVKGNQNIDLSKTQLLIYRKNKEDIEILKEGNRARAGDLLQLAYVSADEPYGMILSLDGRGGITLHFPSEKEGSTELVRNRKRVLSNAIELDDAPGFERFFLITSRHPIDVEYVLSKAGDLSKDQERIKRDKLALPESFSQHSVLILKGKVS